MTNERKITFYYEWLQLQKNEFRILSMLADQGGSYNGNLSPILDYFNLSHQNRNRVQLRDSIIQLKTNEYIIHSETGCTHSLELIPKNTEIQMYAEWYEFLKNHRSTVESVSWIMVLKTYLWILHNNPENIITNKDIAEEINTSLTTLGYAKRVLKEEFEAFITEDRSVKLYDDRFIKIGHQIFPSAWWKNKELLFP